MDHEEEIALLDELLGLRKQNSAFLDEAVTHSPVARYLDTQRFEAEQSEIFRKSPLIAAHVSELPEDGSFLLRRTGGIPVLLTRDRDGEIRAFYNVCRHRGSQLVHDEAGCRHRFTCPYHAWTWDNAGRLIAVPHEAQGFPDLERAEKSLKPIACTVRHGFVWVQIDTGEAPGLDEHVGPIAPELDWLELDKHELFAASERNWACNWKIVVEGGLESYHFRVAHARTIASLFHDNLSTYRMFGPHIRSVLARRTIDELIEQPRKNWKLREHANILYNIFPASVLLVQGDHIVWIQFESEAIDRTRIRCATLIRGDGKASTEKQRGYWQRNHELTITTLNEDFELGESIQKGLALGVNDAMTFGRFEGALDKINTEIEKRIRPH